MSFAAFWLLRVLCRPESQKPPPAIKVGCRRYGLHRTRKYCLPLLTVCFAWLLLSQHVHCCDALQLSASCTKTSTQDDGPFGDPTLTLYGPATEQFAWSTWSQLPPPGNPQQDLDDHLLRYYLTEQGRRMCSHLDVQSGICLSLASSLAGGPPTDQQVDLMHKTMPFQVSRPIPTPSRSFRGDPPGIGCSHDS